MMNVVKKILLAIALPLTLFAGWYFLSADSESFYSPPLEKILVAFGDTWGLDRLRADVAPSVLRLLAGFLLAALIGVGAGVAIGMNLRLRAVTEPVLEFFRAIPPPVLVPVIMLFAGIGDAMKVIVIVFGCIWPILLNTVEGVRAVDSVVLETARSYGVNGVARITKVILPSAGPQIAAGLRQALSIAIILMVISELFAASNGLGFTIVQFQRSFAIPEMWSGIILLGLLGFVLSLLFRLAERRALRWYEGLRAAQRQS
ncbi:ABC-type nitrate/sulfonate/bicarbonate transport system permease component [Actinoplanes campanulatus]|uniref:ABC-type nitrate/sulfonate/bicarbonate transport system permease component n=1 Tax=Actinoplanes campanulatus TaxID=113559 RepID=A0A7W5AG00_9ACTN|nr:ABC transporter permease [Actinoplanes campanulatus]MBB3095346.1 ABC-type nitrate/sulfonate/bicarbonate transport system permease component [Actinoplanes campanulatus]GGN41633.1 nitrate ABC transporter permease [Actinoplanes campanulatus]